MGLLAEKVKKIMSMELIRKYSLDLRQNAANYDVFGEAYRAVGKLRNYIDSLPYLSKLFRLPSELQNFIKKIFYDQKKIPLVEQLHEHQGFNYICSQ